LVGCGKFVLHDPVFWRGGGLGGFFTNPTATDSLSGCLASEKAATGHCSSGTFQGYVGEFLTRNDGRAVRVFLEGIAEPFEHFLASTDNGTGNLSYLLCGDALAIKGSTDKGRNTANDIAALWFLKPQISATILNGLVVVRVAIIQKRERAVPG
jgi:hypothetical protein